MPARIVVSAFLQASRARLHVSAWFYWNTGWTHGGTQAKWFHLLNGIIVEINPCKSVGALGKCSYVLCCRIPAAVKRYAKMTKAFYMSILSHAEMTLGIPGSCKADSEYNFRRNSVPPSFLKRQLRLYPAGSVGHACKSSFNAFLRGIRSFFPFHICFLLAFLLFSTL